jgi:hypothetical protein
MGCFHKAGERATEGRKRGRSILQRNWKLNARKLERVE